MVPTAQPSGISPNSESCRESGKRASISWGEVGGLALGFGSDGVEVDELELEEGLGHRFEGLTRASVEFDLVVEGAEDACDASLLVEGWDAHQRSAQMVAIDARHGGLV